MRLRELEAEEALIAEGEAKLKAAAKEAWNAEEAEEAADAADAAAATPPPKHHSSAASSKSSLKSQTAKIGRASCRERV